MEKNRVEKIAEYDGKIIKRKITLADMHESTRKYSFIYSPQLTLEKYKLSDEIKVFRTLKRELIKDQAKL